MLAVIVMLRPKADRIDEFLAAITAQAEASLGEEPGCLRFDVLRIRDDPDAFMLYEIYADEEAFIEAHRSTAHYAVWDAAAAELLEGARTTILALPVTPELMPESAR